MECFLCGADIVAVGVSDKTRSDFSEICHLVLNPILLVSAGKLKLYGVSFCSGWGKSRGEMYYIV